MVDYLQTVISTPSLSEHEFTPQTDMRSGKWLIHVHESHLGSDGTALAAVRIIDLLNRRGYFCVYGVGFHPIGNIQFDNDFCDCVREAENIGNLDGAIITVHEAAALSGMTAYMVRYAIDAGKLTAWQSGCIWLINRFDFMRFVDNQKKHRR